MSLFHIKNHFLYSLISTAQNYTRKGNKSQFHDTKEVLRVYAFTTYRADIELLTPYFTDLEKPTVKEPQDP